MCLYIYLSIESRQSSRATDHDLQEKEREYKVNACSTIFSLSHAIILSIHITYKLCNRLVGKGAVNITNNYCYRSSISCEQNKHTHM